MSIPNESLNNLGNNIYYAGKKFTRLTIIILVSLSINIAFIICIYFLQKRFLQNQKYLEDLQTVWFFFALSNLIFFSLSIWTLYNAGQSLKKAFRK